MDAATIRKLLPSYGPDWEAAIDLGIDVTLIEHNLSLTPEERLEQLQNMLAFFDEAHGAVARSALPS